MKTSERLQKRLLDDLGFSVEIPQKIPRGYHGRSAGQWAWCAKYTDYGADLGSEDTMAECVQAKTISCYRCLSTGVIHIVAD